MLYINIFCNKQALSIILVVLISLQFLGLILIGVTAYAKVKIIQQLSLPILGGVIACGVFVILIALIGLIGAIRHSQVMLFFVSFEFRIYGLYRSVSTYGKLRTGWVQ